MLDFIRDAPFGQFVRYVTGGRLFQYPEERPDFTCPESYTAGGSQPSKGRVGSPTASASTLPSPEEKQAELRPFPSARSGISLSQQKTVRSVSHGGLEQVGSRTAFQQSRTMQDLEQAVTAATLAKGPTQPIEPATLEDGTILVDWYDTDDPANPHNWSVAKKAFVTFLICVYTTAVYMGSSIYTPSETGVMQVFGVGYSAAALGLSMYVLGYGLGPLIWSPLSEIPAIGRNPPYLITFAIFVILIIPTALVDNFPGLIVLRFLLGFFGSPCLATGGASLQDIYSLLKVPYVLCFWAFAATCGPALGPVISGFSVPAENWRWSSWEMLWLSGPVFLLFFFGLPETFTDSILLQRARRLRKVTGNENLKSQSEIAQGNIKAGELAFNALWRPIQLIIMDPSITFTTVYTALIYGIYYSFFEVFPLVFIDLHGFNVGEMGLTFLSVTVGVLIAITLYWSWTYWVIEPRIKTRGLGPPEERLVPALAASLLLPVGLFIFAWTSRSDIHWIVPVIAILLFTIGIFIVIQCIFTYLAFSYPQYVASVLAGNDMARSMLATGAIHFSRPLFINLGIGPGTSLLAAFTAACIAGVFVLWKFGPWLRERSKFTAK